ncbi:hypothetical protein Athai_55480 [Actinocatenispora thailandica]|uniref:Uncharacterized protein n=1 Tax=Actinocatenispora thailandica TaxID=227318 RepID=A0A7R7DUQ4_9ACTN|nr:hypothetical protein [Actinocatenispora thailandica]BCJ38045.1 hypothetical protein Athai_55480 [Actinocatenispora thailandica]
MTATMTNATNRARTARLAPAVPRQRGGGRIEPNPFMSRRRIEFSAGGFLWR